jgi:hypothetical protein
VSGAGDEAGPNNLKFTAAIAEYKQEGEMQAQVGKTAGEIWHILNDRGPQTLAELKKGLNGSGELVGFAVGWLAREEKVSIIPEKKSFKVALK